MMNISIFVGSEPTTCEGARRAQGHERGELLPVDHELQDLNPRWDGRIQGDFPYQSMGMGRLV